MGYSTQFGGELLFNRLLLDEEKSYIKSLFWLHCDDKEEMEGKIVREKGVDGKKPYFYVQFELNNNETGIQWDGSEKFYGATDAVNFIIDNMKKHYPDLELSGTLRASGESAGDIWLLKIVNDEAIKQEIL